MTARTAGGTGRALHRNAPLWVTLLALVVGIGPTDVIAQEMTRTVAVGDATWVLTRPAAHPDLIWIEARQGARSVLVGVDRPAMRGLAENLVDNLYKPPALIGVERGGQRRGEGGAMGLFQVIVVEGSALVVAARCTRSRTCRPLKDEDLVVTAEAPPEVVLELVAALATLAQEIQ